MQTAPRKKTTISADMDLKPFMNLMVVLIPMLLLSAEFAKVAIIDIALPKDRGSNIPKVQQTPPEDARNKLKLTAIITDSVLTLGARDGFLPSIHYREFHHYIARDDHSEFTVEYVPGKKVTHPASGREMTPFERHDISLYVCNDRRELLSGLYNGYGELITDQKGSPLTTVAAGDSVFALSNPRRLIVVKDPAQFEKRSLSAYDVLQNRLMQVKTRFRDADDSNDIIIAAGNNVLYDKIVQVMDKARDANYPNIMIAKVRG